jgi:hypothetical protein
VVRQLDPKGLDRVREDSPGVLAIAVLGVGRFHIPERRRHGFGNVAERLERLREMIGHACHRGIAGWIELTLTDRRYGLMKRKNVLPSLFDPISREAAVSDSPGCQPRESDATRLDVPSIAAPSPEGAMSGRLMRAVPCRPFGARRRWWTTRLRG